MNPVFALCGRNLPPWLLSRKFIAEAEMSYRVTFSLRPSLVSCSAMLCLIQRPAAWLCPAGDWGRTSRRAGHSKLGLHVQPVIIPPAPCLALGTEARARD